MPQSAFYVTPAAFWITVLLFVVCLIWLGILTAWLFAFSSQRRTVAKAAKAGNIMEVVTGNIRDLQHLQAQVSALGDENITIGERIDKAVQRVGLVRFDAFEDAGGALSFSVALLNNEGDGAVLTAISGRQESRSYAKPVEKGQSPYNLSKEEKEAIARAMA